jgi:CRP/FNR family transcriptional regulator, cyclic AMP receptor protein
VRRLHHDAKVESLGRCPLFEGLDRKHLGELARLTEDVDVPAGEVVWHEGAIGYEFCVIVDGEAEVTRHGQRLATCGPGDFLGEIALIEQVRRTATVTAKTPLRVFVLTGGNLRTVLDHNPEVERKVLRALARRVLALAQDPTLA